MAKSEKSEPGESPPGTLEREAAGKDGAGVKPQDRREMDGDPIAARSSAQQKCTRQRHEKHQNRDDAERDAGVIAIRRGPTSRFRTAALIAVAAIIPSPRGRLGPAPSTTDVFDAYLSIPQCGCARHDQ